MLRYFIFFILFLGLSSCSNNNKTTSTANTPPALEAPTGKPLPYPPLPEEVFQRLYDQCDFVDYIFYDSSLPISISLNEQGSIRTTLKHLSPDPAISTDNCKAMGRVLYQSKGEFIIEADFFLSQGCTYYIFMVDQKPTYAGAMTKEGIAFFTNNIKHAKASVMKKQ